MPLIIGPTKEKLKEKMRGMPQAVLAWCGPALFAGTPDEAIAFYKELQSWGVQYFVANILDGDWETIELLGSEVMPALA